MHRIVHGAGGHRCNHKQNHSVGDEPRDVHDHLLGSVEGKKQVSVRRQGVECCCSFDRSGDYNGGAECGCTEGTYIAAGEPDLESGTTHMEETSAWNNHN